MEFARENERQEVCTRFFFVFLARGRRYTHWRVLIFQITGELMGEAIDDVLTEDGDAEAEEAIVSQVRLNTCLVKEKHSS